MGDLQDKAKLPNLQTNGDQVSVDGSEGGNSLPAPAYDIVADSGDEANKEAEADKEAETAVAETVGEEVQQVDIATYLNELGAIQTEEQRTEAIAQINAMYPSTEDAPNQLNILLALYINQGFAAVSNLPINPDLVTQFKQAGFDAMAAYIAENTTVRRSGNDYNYTSNSIRISQDEQLMRVLHQIGYWNDLERRVVNAGNAQYDAWTPPLGENAERQNQMEESDPDALENLSDIWGVTRGPNGRARMSGRSASNTNDSYWSAVSIASIMDSAGAGDTFEYGDAHTIFGSAAKNNETTGANLVTNPSRLHNAEGENPEALRPGVIMHRNRSGTNVDYDNLRSGLSSHSDVIVAIEVYDASSNRLYPSYEALKTHVSSTLPEEQQAAITPAELEAATQLFITTNNYQLFAVSVGGNTNDENAPTITDDEEGDRSITYNRRSRQTVGRRYWPLNTDRTINNDLNRSDAQVYGIQTWDHPSEAQLAGPQQDEATE